MTYRIRRGGEDLGTASLDELRLRLASGSLTGAELVREETGSEWHPLERVLASKRAAPPVLDSVTKGRGARKAVVIIFAGGAMIALAAAAYFIRSAIKPSRPPLVAGLSAASRPLPNKPTPTAWDVEARVRDFMLREWLEGYQKRGVHGAVPDAATEEFIRVFIDISEEGPKKDSPLSLETESRRLAQDPSCTDPLVLALAASCTLNWYDRVNIYKRARANFPSSRHLAYPALFADVQLMNDSRYDVDQENELNTAALALLEKCFSDGSFRPADQQEIAAVFVDTWGTTFFGNNDAAVCDIVNKAGPSYRWLALVLDGERFIIDAWNARGDGRLDTVSAEQLAKFHDLLAEGGKRLSAAWALHPDYPMAPSLMVYDSLGGTGVEEMRTWFDRAIAAQIDYSAAWSNMRWGLRPRWYGSEAAELALGREALNTGRFDIAVPRKFFDCVLDVESWSYIPDGQRIFKQSDIWPDLQRMYEGYIAEPKQGDARTGWRAAYAIVAYFAGHYDISGKQLEAIGWKLPPKALDSWGVDLSSMPLEVAARIGPLAKGVAEAEAARAKGDRAAALRMYSRLDRENTPDARSREFIRLRLSLLTDEEHLEEGKWVSFMPANDHDANWVYSFGDAHRTEAGDLDVEYGPKGHMLFAKMPIGGNFEVRGRFDVIRSTNTNFQAGIVIGAPDIETFNWFGFRLKRHDAEGDIATFGLGWSLREITQPVSLNDKTNSFDLVLRYGRVTASVNDEQVFNDAELPSTIKLAPMAYLVGLGAFSDSEDAVVRYHGVELRRLGPSDEGQLSGAAGAKPAPAPASSASPAPKVPEQAPSPEAELARAIERVKWIVNQPVLSVPIKDGMNVTWWSDAWFHPGASIPDYANVDVTKTQELPYASHEFVASSLHPFIAFPGTDLEFNPMTKFFYSDLTLPKKRLTKSEMEEINRLYRVIARCNADLAKSKPK